MVDSIAVVALTLVGGLLHQFLVLPPGSDSTTANYTTISIALTLFGYCAGYHNECTKRRRWMWCPHVDVDAVGGQSIPQVGWPRQKVFLSFDHPAYVHASPA